MKATLALVTLAGLGAVAAAVAIGVRTADEQVTAQPYEQGLQWDQQQRAAAKRPLDCDLSRGACEQVAPDGTKWVLAVSPRPVRTLARLKFVATASRAGLPVDGLEVSLNLVMPEMFMGTNRVALAAEGSGQYVGEGTVVSCPSGGKRWRAELSATADGGSAPGAGFDFLADQR